MSWTELDVLGAALLLATTITYVVSPLLGAAVPLKDADATPRKEREEALLRRKAMVYQSIRDSELDRQTGKLSEPDYQEMVEGLKKQAVSVIREIDGLHLKGTSPEGDRNQRHGRP